MPVIVVVMQRVVRALVVDQDAEMRLAIDRQLDVLGWDAIVVNSGDEAVRVIRMGLAVDVLLIELRLPDVDGRDAAWDICQLRPFTRVAFMGTMAPNEPLEPRDAPLLLKPFSTQALRNALSGAIRLTERRW